MKLEHGAANQNRYSPLVLCLQFFHLLQVFQVHPVWEQTASAWRSEQLHIHYLETEGDLIRDRFSRKSNWPNRSICTCVTLFTKPKTRFQIQSARLFCLLWRQFSYYCMEFWTFQCECNYLFTRGSDCSRLSWQPLRHIISKDELF